MTESQAALFEQVKLLLVKATPLLSLKHNDLSQTDREFVVRLARELGLFVKTMADQGDKKIFITRQPIQPVRDEDDEGSEEDESSEDEESIIARERILKKYRLASAQSDEADEFTEYRAKYYRSKMGLEMNQLEPLLKSYLQGLQWVLYYYFCGVPSWSWYFPFHYAPYITDLAEQFDAIVASLPPFDLSEPFKPFEQLMAVLPARSCKLLPEPYHMLMTDPVSTILDFYPKEFKMGIVIIAVFINFN
jgi:5'-3' exoribonuclease 1